MKRMRIQLCALFMFGFGVTGVYAQNTHESVSASGGNASGSGGTASFSVGQVVYTTNTGVNGSVAQGIQQPYEISVIDAIEDAASIDLSFNAYPNPTSDVLTLSTNEFDISNVLYQLFDVNGKLLLSELISSNQTIIDMNIFVSATYFVKIVRNDQIVKTFKIIKNK